MKKTLIAAALVVVTVSLGQAADWPNWRGPDHNGISQETDWFEKWDSSGPERLWNASVGTGWLRSAGVFSDFTLVMEFRFLEAEANSGIFVRTGPSSHDDENGWPNNGYQVQCMDTITGRAPLATMIPYGAPPFEHQSDLAALAKAYKPLGEWQTYEITCAGKTLEVKLNGKRITTATSIMNRQGHIGIQAEHGLLEFRKIDLKPMPQSQQ